MQIMPQTQKSLGVEDPFDPVQSIFGAAKYMDQALTAEGDPERALLYYHGGPGWRQSFGRNKESQNYVPSVARYYNAFKPAQSAPPAPAPPPIASPAPQASNGK